jgi:hypothetical protein
VAQRLSQTRFERKDVAEVLLTELRFLGFLSIRPDLKRLRPLYLVLGLGSAWLVGIGRYWDNPKAHWWQCFGLGSLLYVPALALILWLVLWPLRPRDWRYVNVLTFVGMTAPPGLLYAIPVERWFSLHTSQSINVWFLAAVAAWRVGLLVSFVIRSAGLRGMRAIVAVLLPLALVVTVLAMLNLEHAVFELMGGFRNGTPNDTAYLVLLTLTVGAVALSPILLLMYAVALYRQHRASRATAQSPPGGDAPRDSMAA